MPETPLRYVLFPGRHHVLTTFQGEYLDRVLDGGAVDDLGTPVAVTEDAAVVFVVTSADHGNTRRNPVPGHRREAQVERLAALSGRPYLCFLIDDVPATERFASYVLGSIEADGGPRIEPGNCVVATSTPAVADLYRSRGFRILPVELDPVLETPPDRPWDILERLVGTGSLDDDALHPVSRDVWARYHLLDHAVRVFADPLLSSEGDITGTRDYRTYAAAFDGGAERKWRELAPHVRPGRIVDIGCGAGSLLAEAAADPALAESDLYGIEAARPLHEECLHRRRAGVFENPNTFFYQRNFMEAELFDPGSMDTTLTSALTHEIWSYLGEPALEEFVARVHDHTRRGGVWLNLDVCGPDDGARHVWLDLGVAESEPPVVAPLAGRDRDDVRAVVESLSPVGSFCQFAVDWYFDAPFELREVDGRMIVETSMRVAMEWLTRKDYPDNWLSEMHESFCHWSFGDWEDALQRGGFELAPGSRAITNPWLVEHRFAPVATLRPVGSLDQSIAWPTTHALLVARRSSS